MLRPDRRSVLAWSLAAGAGLFLPARPLKAFSLTETSTLDRTHAGANIPPLAERLPKVPLVLDLPAMGRSIGRHGGDLNTLIGRAKDARLINVIGYARLVGYTQDLELKADILERYEVDEERIFTLHLRPGHRWSDGQPFTTEDIRYWWEDIVNNKELSPAGPDPFLQVNGELPVIDFIDETTVRFSWSKPNPQFLPMLAAARDPFIYRPAHYLRQFHIKYGLPEKIEAWAKEGKFRSWAALHNARDDMYNGENRELPTLQPWALIEGDKRRQVAIRNLYFHRIDSAGQQLPYVDRILMTVSDGKLIPARTQTGESDLQTRGLSFPDITVLKRGEENGHYRTLLWPISKGAQVALYPNLNARDPVWRALFQDVRFRRALSLGVDREMINRVLYFGLAQPAPNSILPLSPLFKEEYRTAWTQYDPEQANALLDAVGLTKRRGDHTRLLPDGRPLEIITETSGESTEEADALALVAETWRDIGVKIFVKPTQREVMRNRAVSGDLLMSAFSGVDNGIPTADMMPREFVPLSSDFLSAPVWGGYMESNGKNGQPIDYQPALDLVSGYEAWMNGTSRDARRAAWEKILSISADQVFSIGLVAEVLQPIVFKDDLMNMPDKGFFGWDPGALLGIYNPDAFWLDRPAQSAKG
ncbi:ABC transporter substrate-binding protein [Segnochrobactraceae bacterium EtOH-i3]